MMITRMALLVLLGLSSVLANAQCDKKVKFVSEKVYAVNADTAEGESLPVHGNIRLSKDSIFVSMQWQNGQTTEVRGSNAEIICKMNDDYKEGTIDIKSNAEIKANGQSSQSKMLFNIRSKAGKIKIYAVPEDEKEKICFAIKEWQEIK